MFNILYVGDCHATADSLQEMKALIGLIKDTAEKHKVRAICFLGDQFHTHATMNMYVLKFWQDTIAELSMYPQIYIVGNHDIPGATDPKEVSAMSVFKNMNGVDIIDEPQIIYNIQFMPYFHDKTAFEAYKPSWEVPTLVCHQTFLGCQYENGFYDKDGARQELLPYDNIISGHIHKEGVIGNVHYLGSPRWRSVDDCNERKYIWVIKHDEDGDVISETPIYTGTVCKPMVSAQWKEGQEPPDVLASSGHITIDLVGSEEWIRRIEEQYKGKGIRIRRFFVTQSAPKVKESDGLAISFKKYVDAYPYPNSSKSEDVWQQIAPNVSWLNG